MNEAWRVVHRAGVPLAGARDGTAPPLDAIASATREVVAHADEASPREREALGAFVLAWSAEWPRAFASAFGEDAPKLLAWADRVTVDPDRRIKLRRIAIENLSRVL